MAAADGGGAAFAFSVASVVEDVLQQHGSRSRDLDLDARRAEEAAIRRYEAASWLRRMVGVVGAKDLPAEPSEEEFRLGLRSGIILCNVLNKVQSGAVSKVVESPCDAALIPDGAALSAFQYFENVRNFLVAVQDLGMPSFEASDLEQGGKSSRIVNCVMALKSFSEWKQAGSNGMWKFGGNVKQTTTTKQFVRKNSEPFTSSITRTTSMDERSSIAAFNESSSNNKLQNSSLSLLIRTVLMDKKPEDVPNLVESVLNKVVEEFEQRISTQIQQHKVIPSEPMISQGNELAYGNAKVENKCVTPVRKEDCFQKSCSREEELKSMSTKQLMIVDQQQTDIKELKRTLCITKSSMQFMQSKFHEEVDNLGRHIHGLAHAASGYHRVLEENRRLYNQVQDLKGSIRVYCRVRPFSSRQTNFISTVEHIEEGTITVSGTQQRNGKGRRSFSFNKVFSPLATQAEVFSDTQPLIRSVLDGYNVCIFAYGQTGSGKTYTMSGPRDLTEQTKGVNYRALSDLFLLAEQRKDTFCYEVSVQMIEIYNEQVRDLLTTDGLNKRLEIRNNSQTGLNVPDANLVRVSSTYDVIDLMNLGHKNRAVGATALNDRSSRSHSCLTVHVQGRELTSGNLLRGCMHLVDLAGSERVDKSEVTGDRLKEAQHINKSLSALGDVIASLAQKNAHVPYRNSKLTQLLQDSLGGQAKTLMFVHISPEHDAIGETISTLKFAERVATVELGAARVNKDSTDVKDLKEQIASLKAALVQKESENELKQQSKMSPFRPSLHERKVSSDFSSQRNPMGEVDNIEVCTNSSLRRKKQSFDLDELLGNSPPWPPVSSNTNGVYGEDDRDMGSGEWVDKVMVNKQDNSPMECWDENGTDNFFQKYMSSPSSLYPEKTYHKLMPSRSPLDFGAADELDELDAATSDSSEPDLFWQLNHAKLSSFSNGGSAQKVQKQNSKLGKNSELRSGGPKLGPSPSTKKMGNVGGHPPLRNGRVAVHSSEGKRKTVTRK